MGPALTLGQDTQSVADRKASKRAEAYKRRKQAIADRTDMSGVMFSQQEEERRC